MLCTHIFEQSQCAAGRVCVDLLRTRRFFRSVGGLHKSRGVVRSACSVASRGRGFVAESLEGLFLHRDRFSRAVCCVLAFDSGRGRGFPLPLTSGEVLIW